MNIDLGLSVTKEHDRQTKIMVLEHRVGHKEFFNGNFNIIFQNMGW